MLLLLSEPETRLLLREAHGAYDTRINDLLLAALQLAFKRWCGRDVLAGSHGKSRQRAAVRSLRRERNCRLVYYGVPTAIKRH